jgi:hypothetical protein
LPTHLLLLLFFFPQEDALLFQEVSYLLSIVEAFQTDDRLKTLINDNHADLISLGFSSPKVEKKKENSITKIAHWKVWLFRTSRRPTETVRNSEELFICSTE